MGSVGNATPSWSAQNCEGNAMPTTLQTPEESKQREHAAEVVAHAASVPVANKRSTPAPEESFGGEVRPEVPTIVMTQTGHKVEILYIRRICLMEGEGSPIIGDVNASWKVMADLASPEPAGKGEATLMELRRNLYEHEAKDYAHQFTHPGIDFYCWENGSELINPRYKEEFPHTLLPWFEIG